MFVSELDLPELDYFDPELRGPRFHEVMHGLAAGGWIAKMPLGYVVLDRESSDVFLRSRSTTFPGMMVAEVYGVTEGPLREEIDRNILHLNGDQHRRLRGLVNHAFTPKAADAWRPVMREFIEDLFAAVADAGRCEAVEAFCKPYPALTIATLMGAPVEDAGRLAEWSNWIQRQFAADFQEHRERIEQACAELYEYLGELLDAKRANPGDDLISSLIGARDGDDKLNNAELVNLPLNVLVGGVDTTQSQLAQGLRLFAEHPDQWQLIREQPELIPGAVDEIIRHEPITPFTARICLEDVEHRGVTFPRDTIVMVAAFTANHEDVDGGFDITRPAGKTWTFGAGIHYCLGANLAKAELQEALAHLAPRMPGLALDGEPVFESVQGIYGLGALPLRWDTCSQFGDTIAKAYSSEGPAVELGRGVHSGSVALDAVVQIPLAMMNRHGLVAGATGTGKTKTLQVMAEQLSAQGVAVFVADVKGDVSGLAHPGDPDGPAGKRSAQLGIEYAPEAFPVEIYSLGGLGPGIPIRATVSDFGPQLLGKILGANETQEQSLALVFHYADSAGLPLLDLADLRALLMYLDSDEGKAELEGIGGLSSATVGVLLRSLVGLEDGGGNELFGEPQLDVADLMRVTADGRGVVSVLELPAVQDKPALWSTALMWLVAELFETLPEAGDLPKPKLVFFFDEAHLLFDGATDAFLAAIEQTVRLIRSKGVGVFFVTQTPKDVPGDVLAQLGNRVQHALRAFTPDDAKALKATVSTFPKSDLYDLEELLPALGIGEAAVTILSENGVPTPVVHCRMVAPRSRMAPADDVDALAKASPLFARYGTRVDSESAREKLAARLDAASEPAKEPMEHVPAPKPPPRREPKADANPVTDFLRSREGKALQRKVVRGVFGMLRKRL